MYRTILKLIEQFKLLQFYKRTAHSKRRSFLFQLPRPLLPKLFYLKRTITVNLQCLRYIPRVLFKTSCFMFTFREWCNIWTLNKINGKTKSYCFSKSIIIIMSMYSSRANIRNMAERDEILTLRGHFVDILLQTGSWFQRY